MADSRNPALNNWLTSYKKLDINLKAYESVFAYRSFPMQFCMYAMIEKCATPASRSPNAEYSFTQLQFRDKQQTAKTLFTFASQEYVHSAYIFPDSIITVEQGFCVDDQLPTLRHIKVRDYGGNILFQSDPDRSLIDVFPITADVFISSHWRITYDGWGTDSEAYLAKWEYKKSAQPVLGSKKHFPRSHVSPAVKLRAEYAPQVDFVSTEKLRVNGVVISVADALEHKIQDLPANPAKFLCQVNNAVLSRTLVGAACHLQLAPLDESKEMQPTKSVTRLDPIQVFPMCNGNVVAVTDKGFELTRHLRSLEHVPLADLRPTFGYKYGSESELPIQRKHPDDWTDTVCTNVGLIFGNIDEFFILWNEMVKKLRGNLIGKTQDLCPLLPPAVFGLVLDLYLNEVDVVGADIREFVQTELTAREERRIFTQCFSNLTAAMINELQNRQLFPETHKTQKLFGQACKYMPAIRETVQQLEQLAQNARTLAAEDKAINCAEMDEKLKTILVAVFFAIGKETCVGLHFSNVLRDLLPAFRLSPSETTVDLAQLGTLLSALKDKSYTIDLVALTAARPRSP